MKKITKNYYGPSVILVGYSSDKNSFSRMVYRGMVDAGIKVFPVNKNKEADYDVLVYNDLAEIPEVTATACVLTSRANMLRAIEELKDYGIKRIQVQSKKSVDQEMMDYCSKMNIELSIGCPMMAIGSGFHRFHGFLAGVR